MLSALPTQHTGPKHSHPEAGLVTLWNPRRWVRPAPASFIPSPHPPCLSLSFPVYDIDAHQEQSCPPLRGARQDISCKIPVSQVAAVQWVDVVPMTVCNPFSAGVCPGLCGVSGSSGAGVQSTTKMMSVIQHKLDVSSSHACDVRLH